MARAIPRPKIVRMNLDEHMPAADGLYSAGVAFEGCHLPMIREVRLLNLEQGELEVSDMVRPGMVLIPHGFGLIYNGTVDLDGASDNREAIIQNDSGATLYLRTAVEATQGLTKGGQSSVPQCGGISMISPSGAFRR